MTFQILEKAKELPVSMEMAKTYLRIQHEEEDALVEHLIKTASEWIQESTGKSLLHQKCQYTHANQHFFLPYGPVCDVTEVKVKGKILEAEHYSLDMAKGFIALELPLFRRSSTKVTVTYKAGFGEKPEDIPEAIRNAILTAIAYLYENRDNAEPKLSLSAAIKPWIQYHKEYHLA
ncbi:MAG: head-tail connector protein [Alphaproteobacteria bacterium]